MPNKVRPRTLQFAVIWTPRQVPLVPAAVAARGEAALRLARKLLQLNDETLGQLLGVAGERLLVIRGAPGQLPWVEGVQYLGNDSDHAAFFSPTSYGPSVPHPLLASALAGRMQTAGPFAVLPNPGQPLLVPLKSARPISRQALTAWLEQQ